ncbi:MAG: type II toxin-antitoxin system HicA family toxin [Desulfobulbaceae bacterium]|nr:MAG: type II toxin-antitoxin system HicA family toxin [Desulfobulbaceae bacterium]
MSRLNPISHQNFIRKLRQFGFEGPHAGGKHLYMLKGGVRLTIPNIHKQKIGVNLLMLLLKQAGVARDEWMENE